MIIVVLRYCTNSHKGVNIDTVVFSTSLVDGNIVGMMHLDVKQVNTESQDPLQINIDSDTGIVSGHYFNFNDHKPTFKLDAKDQATVSLTGGLLTAPYVMDQFHFHIYCTRTEAEQNTLDRAQVPGEVNEWESPVNSELSEG